MNDLPLLPSVCTVPLDYGWVCVCAQTGGRLAESVNCLDLLLELKPL